MKNMLKEFRETIIPGVLNSYSVIFFFNNRIIAVLLFAVTFLNFYAGLSGLIAVIFSVLLAALMGFEKLYLKQGLFSFNALLAGLCLGTFFEPGLVFMVLLLLVSLISLILSVSLSGWLGKKGLPFLSIPFIIVTWMIILPYGQLEHLGLTQRNVFWINEVYAAGGKPVLDFFQTVESLPLNDMITIFLRSLSSIFFQDNLLAGILIAVAILAGSRITFLLALTGYISAYIFAKFVGADMLSFSFYNIGANYILVAIAIGGFYLIPSIYSFLWAAIMVPVTSLLILFLTRLLGPLNIPVFSLPFSIVTITFLSFLYMRARTGKLIITPVQNYSPEINLYSYNINSVRLEGTKYHQITLPFWGEWTVSQGYDGKFTHLGEWGKALDFVIESSEGKHWTNNDTVCDNYLCFKRPVISPGNGYVAEIIDNIEDNEPGKVNTLQNWGNTVVLQHSPGLFTQLSHLEAGSIKVKKGDYVKQGDMLGLCGNSGRSPEPHIHFQVQSSPFPGAKTLHHPISYYLRRTSSGVELQSFSIPREGEIISNVETSGLLRSAFDLQPGMILRFSYKIGDSEPGTAEWEVFTDAWNYKYLWCRDTKSIAWFINDGYMMTFTSFAGDRKSLLYYFYLSCYRVFLASYPGIRISDQYPLHIVRKFNPLHWIHDLVAPFHQFVKISYTANCESQDLPVNPGSITLRFKTSVSFLKRTRETGSGTILLENNSVKEFSFLSGERKVWAKNLNI